MLHEYSRTEALIGEDGIKKLSKANVIVFGIGGVGSYVVEALARCGVGSLTLVDNDVVAVTNINRQLIALHSTIGLPKTEVAKKRVLDIDPEILVHTYETFYGPQTKELFKIEDYDYVVDAIDTVTSKLTLIEECHRTGTKIISCMGTGNKLDPSKFEIADISKTNTCPLAKAVRTELRKRGIKKCKVLFSKELPVKSLKSTGETKGNTDRPVPGSISFVPSVAGLMIAGEVIRDLLGGK